MKYFAILLIGLTLAGCQSAEKYEAQNCHYDGAYEQGANDAKNKNKLQGESIAYRCPENTRAEVRRGYRAGYENFAKENQGFVDILKDKIRGTDKPKTCVQTDNEQVCGYGCIESDGKAKCAQKPTHACISSGGKFHCGLNCRETRPGKVTCDEREKDISL